MFKFRFNIPTVLIFEANSISQIGNVVKGTAKQVLLLVGKSSMKRTGVLDRTLSHLKDAGVKVVVYDGIPSNPTADHIYNAAERIKSSKCDAIIGLGGGSVMDAARAVSLVATHDGDFWDYRVTGPKSVGGIQNKLIPVFTISTAAGTGSELSPAALVTKNGLKEVFFSPFMFPHTAIIDPVLSVSLPPELTARIGIDAFVQGLEAYVSLGAQPFSDTFALEGMRITLKWLGKAISNGNDLEARTYMFLASVFSLFAINQAGVGAIHALSDPLSGHYDVHHGLALSVLIPKVVAYNWSSNPEKYSVIADLLGIDTKRVSADRLADETSMKIEEWLTSLGLGVRLSSFGVKPNDLEKFAREAQNPDMATNPRKMSEEDVKQIYLAIM